MNGTIFYEPGYRVALISATDPDSAPPSGTTGTVWRYRADQTAVTVHWDNATTQLLHLDAGDSLDLLPPDFGTAGAAARTPFQADQWMKTLDAVMGAAERDAEATAQRWADAAFAGQDRASTVATALRTADGIEDHNPSIILALPLWQLDLPDNTPGPDEPEPLTPQEWWARTAPPDAPSWDALDGARRSEVIRAYADTHDHTLLTLLIDHCHRLASPTGDHRQVAHLDPDELTPGSTAIFAGDWVSYLPDGSTEARYTVGYVGVFIDRWNGWAVFSCSREVAEAIVANQEEMRTELRTALLGQGGIEDDADRQVDASLSRLYFDGDTLVDDQRGLRDDPDALYRTNAGPDGQWVVMGWDWTWEAVPHYRCDRIVGTIPAPAERQAWVQLAHTGVRVPHARLKLVPTVFGRDRDRWGTLGVFEYDTIEFDGVPVGVAHTNPSNPDAISWSWEPAAGFGAAEFSAFARAAWYRGEPVTEGQLMTLLVTEAAVSEAIEQAAHPGGTVARLLDARGDMAQVHQVWPAPAHSRRARENAGRTLAGQHPVPYEGALWEIWTHTGWRYAAPAQAHAPSTAPQPEGGTSEAVAGLLAGTDRDDLIEMAALNGVLLSPYMDTPALRATLQAEVIPLLQDQNGAEHPGTDEFPWSIVAVLPASSDPDAATTTVFAYTVGLTGIGQPELLAAGLPPQISGALLNELARRVHDQSEQFHHGQQITGLLGGWTVVVVEGPPTDTLHPGAALNRYGTVRLQQIVLPDAEGRYPWDEGYPHAPHVQPVLSTPPFPAPDSASPAKPTPTGPEQP